MPERNERVRLIVAAGTAGVVALLVLPFVLG